MIWWTGIILSRMRKQPRRRDAVRRSIPPFPIKGCGGRVFIYLQEKKNILFCPGRAFLLEESTLASGKGRNTQEKWHLVCIIIFPWMWVSQTDAAPCLGFILKWSHAQVQSPGKKVNQVFSATEAVNLMQKYMLRINSSKHIWRESYLMSCELLV